MSQLIIICIVPIFLISIIFSLFVWVVLTNKYKKDYMQEFNVWEREEIQKCIYEQKNKYEIYGEKVNSNKLDLILVKWEVVAGLRSLK